MADGSLLHTDIDAWLARHQAKDLLRFITCGSVDDGKSTLIGRLLYDTGAVPDDEIARLQRDSARGSAGGELDFSLLVDGLAAEREQGITIDVAYRYFATEARKFIVADTPGHEQYTRNMITGASTAETAVILVDARKGVLTQTRRHSFLVSLVGIRRVVLAVNKMDLVGFAQDVFDGIVADYRAFAQGLGFAQITAIPISGRDGDNIALVSARTPWYAGPTLLGYLETTPIAADELATRPFRMAVQGVIRPDLSFRGFTGQISAGQLRVGDEVRVCPSGRTTRVARIVGWSGDLPQATAGQSVTVTLADEVDVSRGDVLAAAANPPESAERFAATLVWMDEQPMVIGRSYWLKIGARTVAAVVAGLDHRVDVNTLEHLPAARLELNEIGSVVLRLDQTTPFDPYDLNVETGGFILIDRVTNATIAAGMLRAAERRADNIHWHAQTVDKSARARLKGQRSAVLWLTGLSGAGKSTLANRIEQRLLAEGRHTYILDGDNVRHGLNKDLGFSEADRVENIRRVAEVARLMEDAGLIVLVAFISPFRADRDLARGLMAPGEFIEVHVDAPLAVAEARDPKGLYRKARAGELKNFTGIDSPYEPPIQPEVYIDTTTTSPDAAADRIVRLIEQRGLPGVDGEGI